VQQKQQFNAFWNPYQQQPPLLLALPARPRLLLSCTTQESVPGEKHILLLYHQMFRQLLLLGLQPVLNPSQLQLEQLLQQLLQQILL
jgi:hypothetical protein